MKHIIIDARLYGPKHTGIGRYTKNLLLFLSRQPDFSTYKFSLIIYKDLESEIKNDLNDKFNYISTNIRHYSIREQLFLPFILYRLHPNLVHFTHFNKPILYFGKSVVTIHDLIKHFYKGPQNSTKNSIIYWIKYFFYIFFTNLIIKTNNLIVPSNFWKNFIIKKFKISPQKITTTYEAVDPAFIKKNMSIKNSKPAHPTSGLETRNYIIYTGNLYPHKNINIILQALQLLPNIKLKIICARNFFSQKVEKLIKDYKIQPQVEFLGYIPDSQFKKIYQQALALVHPSFMEGFSLTGLEAMALDCPVISSNSSCLPEIYDNSVLYFDPKQPKELINQINILRKSPNLREKMIKLGKQQVKKYSWNKTAKQTFFVYKNIINC